MYEDRPWIAEIMRQQEATEAARRQTDDDLLTATRRRRSRVSGSVVYSMRLDPLEVDALERRAQELGIGATVLARNLIRNGLRAGPATDLA